MAIYFHGLLQLIRQNISRLLPILLDVVMVGGAFVLTSKAWAVFRFHNPDYFNPTTYWFNIPLYTLLMVLSMFLNGAYDRPFNKKSSWIGFVTGILMILVVYAILPVHLRSSRMVILTGSGLYMLWLLLSRSSLKPWRAASTEAGKSTHRKAIIIAGKDEAGRIKELINRSRDQIEIIGTVDPQADTILPAGHEVMGNIAQLDDMVRIHQVKEVIFSAQDVPFSVFTGCMTRLGPSLRYMLAASTTMNIVGSMSKDTEGESYAIHVHFKLSQITWRRAKRIFDMISSLILIVLFPALIFFIPSPFTYLSNAIQVMLGQKTWVSYHPLDPVINSLPPVRQGVLHPAYPRDETELTRRLQHIHYVYARDYHWTTDLAILTSQLKRTGQNNSGYAR